MSKYIENLNEDSHIKNKSKTPSDRRGLQPRSFMIVLLAFRNLRNDETEVKQHTSTKNDYIENRFLHFLESLSCGSIKKHKLSDKWG